MTTALNRIAGILGFLLISTRALALPIPPSDYQNMIRAADLIVIGRVARPFMNGADVGRGETFFVEPDRVLKGKLPHVEQLIVQTRPTPEQFAYANFVSDGQYGMFFLQQGSDGGYTVVDPVHPATIASPVYGKVAPDALDPVDAVILEFTRVLATPPAQLTDPKTGIRDWPLAPTLGGFDDGGLVDLPGPPHPITRSPTWAGQSVDALVFRDLQLFPSERVSGPMRSLAASNEVLPRLFAAGYKLLQGDPSDLPAVAPLLMSDDPNLLPTVTLICGYIPGDWQPSGDLNLVLETLMTSPITDVRRAAGQMLSMSDPASFTRDWVKALDDPDPTVQFLAVNGMISATGGAKRIDVLDFRAHGPDYLRQWKEWARENMH